LTKKHAINLRLRERKALSPIFATMILAAIVISLGSVAYYYVNNVTTNNTNQLKDNIADSQQIISERISVENVKYIDNSAIIPSTPDQLKIYIINSGIENAVIPRYVFIYNSNNVLIDYVTASQLKKIDSPYPTITGGLNVGKEAYFTADLLHSNGGGKFSLSSPSTYLLHIVTENGAGFDYVFTK